jgi:hypothetical protein
VWASVPRKSAGSNPCNGRASGVGSGVGGVLAETGTVASAGAVGDAAPGVGAVLQAASRAMATKDVQILRGRIGS